MARVKGAMMTRKRRNKTLKLAKSYWGSKSTHFKMAKQAVKKSGVYAYIGRKQKKRDFRRLWIARISAAVKPYGMNYSRFIIDNPPKDPEEALRLHNQVWNCGVRAALANGGVLNDHHGVGLKLSRLVKEQYGPAIQVLQALKKELDPNGIMNPYKLGL